MFGDVKNSHFWAHIFGDVKNSHFWDGWFAFFFRGPRWHGALDGTMLDPLWKGLASRGARNREWNQGTQAVQWGCPKNWMVYFMGNPMYKWMIWMYSYFRKPPCWHGGLKYATHRHKMRVFFLTSTGLFQIGKQFKLWQVWRAPFLGGQTRPEKINERKQRMGWAWVFESILGNCSIIFCDETWMVQCSR